MTRFTRTSLVFSSLFLLASCIGERNEDNLSIFEGEHVSIVVSSNINGEVETCGCGKNPRGGLPAVAGLLHSIQSSNPILYIDAGNTFFPRQDLPSETKDYLQYSARQLFEGLSLLELAYHVPGPFDLAAYDFLKSLKKTHFLIGNINKSFALKSVPFFTLKLKDQNIYITSLVSLNLLPPELTPFFTSPDQSLKEIIHDIEKSDSNYQLIVISHAPKTQQQELLSKFPTISYLIDVTDNSKVNHQDRMITLEKRNYYLAEIKFSVNDPPQVLFHETIQEYIDVYKSNPLSLFVEEYKEKMKIYEEKNYQFLKPIVKSCEP